MWRRGGERRRIRRKNKKTDGAEAKESIEETKARIKKKLKTGIAITSILGHERSKKTSQTEDEKEYEWLNDGYLSTSDEDIEHAGDKLVPYGVTSSLDSAQSRAVYRCSNMTEVCFRNNLLSDNQVKTIMVSMMNGGKFTSLDFAYCQLSTQALRYICEVLHNNSTLEALNLSGNSLKTNGACLITESIKNHIKLQRLNIDKNDLKDSDSFYIYNILVTSTTIQYLGLSNNHFSMQAGAYIGEALQINDSLKELDLSWNKFRLDGAVLLVHGLKHNITLTDLNLAWNGLGTQGCKALDCCLQINNTLQTLDLTSNRITRDDFQHIINGLTFNNGVRRIRIGMNPITTDGIIDFMSHILTLAPEMMSKLELIDFSDICVGPEFKQMHTEILKKRKLDILHGPTMRQDDIGKVVDWTTVVDSEQPIFVLFDCMRHANLRVTDIFHAFDKDKSNTLTREELKQGLLTMNMPLSVRALDLLIEHTDVDNDGEVSLTELLAVQKDYLKYLAKKRNNEDDLLGSAMRRLKSQPTLNA